MNAKYQSKQQQFNYVMHTNVMALKALNTKRAKHSLDVGSSQSGLNFNYNYFANQLYHSFKPFDKKKMSRKGEELCIFLEHG